MVRKDRPITNFDKSRMSIRQKSRKLHSGEIEIASGAATEPPLQGALDTLSAQIAVLDPRGVIVAVNRAWRRFGRQNGLKLPNAAIGSDYLSALSKSADMVTLRRQLREVLRGRALGFRHYYWCLTPKGLRHFEMQVRRCGRSKGRRIFVAHEDITDLKRAEDGLRKLVGELAQSRDAERRRLARELHDTTCQDLVVASLAVARIETLLPEKNKAMQGAVGELSQALERALRDLRTLSYLLHAPVVTGPDLAATLRMMVTEFARRAGIKVKFTTNYAGRPSEAIERTILSIIKEALVNIHRHSGSKTVRVALSSIEGSLALAITDQGQWRKGVEGVGLASMRERVAEVKGALTVRASHRGTRLFAVMPAEIRPLAPASK